jgi:hypothetical protein
VLDVPNVKLLVPAPILALAFDFSVELNPWLATVLTALKFPTFPNPTSEAVVPCGLVPVPG